MNQPSFAIISAVYNVARYLPDFFASLDTQTYSRDLIRVILVVDGATDGSLERCHEWAASTDFQVDVLVQKNAGQGAARNAGIDLVADDDIDWLSFVDPDDFLDEDYFTNLAAFAAEYPSTVLLSGHQTDYFEDDPSKSDRHPLRFRYEGGDQLVDIERFPRFFQLGLAAAALRREPFRDSSLRFDTRIRPNFEDGHLIARYLLRCDRTFLGFVASAVYWYRRRSDGTSTLQGAAQDPRRYTDVVEHGYLDVLRTAHRAKGRVPEWLQTVVVYELAWIFRAEDAMFGGTASLSSETTERFHELVAQCREYLDGHVIEGFSVVKFPTAPREALLHGYDATPWHWGWITIDARDEDSDLVMLVYHYTGDAPHEEITLRGRVVAPRFSKTRDFVYLRQPLVHERILWVSTKGDLAVRLDGVPIPLTARWPHPSRYSLRPPEIERARRARPRGGSLAAAPGRRKPKPAKDPQARRLEQAQRLARATPVAQMFKDAWVLMDRSHNAHDNAEHLFTYLRKSRRDINAWFVVKKGSPDWDRLRRAGFKRLIPHGSLLWMALCLHATHIVSSHADRYVYHPFDVPGGWNWSFTFLQHGVTTNDISRWLNSKTIDLLITTTAQEHASVAGDGSGYKFSSREVVQAGMPRLDRLDRLARAGEVKKRRGPVVVMPTWRQYLAGMTIAGTGEQSTNTAFAESSFAARWRDLVRSSEVRAACNDHGVELLFMPHPNLEPYIEEFGLPDEVRRTTYGASDVQQVIAEASMVVTDYSSIAFDAAFARRPVVYYQFDRESVFGGGHIVRPGYFHYGEHGFGPVAKTHDDAVEAIVRQIRAGAELEEPYVSRVESAFTLPRTGASERVVAAIERIGYKGSRKELETPVPTPKAPPIAYDQ